MKVAILNTSILTNYGRYRYEPIALGDARELATMNGPPLSAVGHESTAAILTELLGVAVPVNRIQFSQEIEQSAIVFKLRGRAPEGAILSREQIEAIGYDFGLLFREE